MKEEILRFHSVSLKVKNEKVLDDVSFCVTSGEVIGLLFRNDRGEKELKSLIQFNSHIHNGRIYFENNLVNNYYKSDLSANRVAVIQEEASLIPGLSIADNVFVMRRGFRKFHIKESVLENQLERALKETGIQLDIHKQVERLTVLERCVTELMKAWLGGCRLVILDYLSNFMSPGLLAEFNKMIRHMADQGMAFLYVCHHHEEGFRYTDRLLLFSDGMIKKKFDKDEMTEENIRPFIQYFKANKGTVNREEDIIFEAERISCGGREEISFQIRAEKTTTILDMDNQLMGDLIGILSGEIVPDRGRLMLEGNDVTESTVSDRLKEGILLMPEDPVKNFLFPCHSYMENLTFLLDRKLGTSILRRKYLKSVREEYGGLAGACIDAKDITQLTEEQLYTLAYLRARLYHPKLLVLVQPVMNETMYGRQNILRLIEMMQGERITILILTTAVSDNLKVSDYLLIARKGKVVAEYSEREFSSFTEW